MSMESSPRHGGSRRTEALAWSISDEKKAAGDRLHDAEKKESKMTGVPPVLIKPEEGVKLTGALGGYGYRILTHKHSSNLVMGIIYVDPGKAPHRWHTHEKSDSAGGFKVTYPENFEEAFVIVQGKGLLQWKEDGEIRKRELKPATASTARRASWSTRSTTTRKLQ